MLSTTTTLASLIDAYRSGSLSLTCTTSLMSSITSYSSPDIECDKYLVFKYDRTDKLVKLYVVSTFKKPISDCHNVSFIVLD